MVGQLVSKYGFAQDRFAPGCFVFCLGEDPSRIVVFEGGGGGEV